MIKDRTYKGYLIMRAGTFCVFACKEKFDRSARWDGSYKDWTISVPANLVPANIPASRIRDNAAAVALFVPKGRTHVTRVSKLAVVTQQPNTAHLSEDDNEKELPRVDDGENTKLTEGEFIENDNSDKVAGDYATLNEEVQPELSVESEFSPETDVTKDTKNTEAPQEKPISVTTSKKRKAEKEAKKEAEVEKSSETNVETFINSETTEDNEDTLD